LYGDANDYVAKGLSGGRVVVRPDRVAHLDNPANVIAGNVIGYGATSGEVFIRGRVGERFFVRNSGATGVVEGVGDHGAEYMTGGTLVVIGTTGRNFGAGMSGGTAYVLDLDVRLVNQAALASGELGLAPLDDDDAALVLDLLRAHAEHTGSHLAEALLRDPAETRARFTRVLPREYARVREAISRAHEEGLDISSPGVWAEIMEATRG